VTELVLQQRPELLNETLRDAKMMAEALDGVWNKLDGIAQEARWRADSFERRGLRLIVNRIVTGSARRSALQSTGRIAGQ
jgi:hypothetical protein